LYDASSSTLAETYASKNVGTGLTLTPTATIPDASNYAVTLASASTGVITPAGQFYIFPAKSIPDLPAFGLEGFIDLFPELIMTDFDFAAPGDFDKDEHLRGRVPVSN
jgi:hypothetical protein